MIVLDNEESDGESIMMKISLEIEANDILNKVEIGTGKATNKNEKTLWVTFFTKININDNNGNESE